MIPKILLDSIKRDRRWLNVDGVIEMLEKHNEQENKQKDNDTPTPEEVKEVMNFLK